MLSAVLDLLLPLQCGGCGAPGIRWCAACAESLAPGPDDPQLITTRVDPGVPVFALGRYAGSRRVAIIDLKDRGRADLITPLAVPIAHGLHRLVTWGMVVPPLCIVPAPSRPAAARRRGGDPVTRLAVAATRGHPGITVDRALRMATFARDSVGLDRGARERNVAGRIVLRHPPPPTEILLLDDIVTTGATAAESVRVLRSAGAHVRAVLVLAHA